MGEIAKVVVTCPVRRLGSLMDFSPLLHGLAKHFAARLVLASLSSQASSLWRHKIKEVELLGGKGGSSKGGRVLGIPLADDGGTSIEAYDQLVKHTPPQSYRIGIDRAKVSIERYFDEDDFHSPPYLRERPDYFDRVIQTKGETFPRPIILNAYLEVLKAALEEDGEGTAFASLTEEEKRPLIWTGPEERRIAEEYFYRQKLLPERTIGFHLTAGSYCVYRDIWPRELFLAVARHFIERGYSVLAVTGGFGNCYHGADKSVVLHRAFIEALRASYGSSVFRHAFSLFHGETLAQAEVIRRCAVFLSAETGPAHLASAVGTPKVTIAASQRQADLWMLTGARDFGFVSRRKESAPRAAAVIEAMEKILCPADKAS